MKTNVVIIALESIMCNASLKDQNFKNNAKDAIAFNFGNTFNNLK